MANRYLRATGNWNGSVWASTSGGTAGSAATPTVNDTVYIAANYTVTLTADAACWGIRHTNGTLSLGSYKLVSGASYGGGFISSGSTARTINLGSGTLDVSRYADAQPLFELSGSNLTFNAGTSLVILRKPSYSEHMLFDTAGKTFNDVRILLGDEGDPQAGSLAITGSPTFRSLIIQSNNGSAHTVNFDDYAQVSLDKFIGIGASTGNRLKLSSTDEFAMVFFDFPSLYSSYGQFLDMGNLVPSVNISDPTTSAYIGVNSIANYDGAGEWVIADPPKISTLVDPLTTAPGSNTNWTVTGTVTQVTSGHEGGGYQLSLYSSIISTDTFDAVTSSLVFQTVGSWTMRFVTPYGNHLLVANKYYRFNVSTGGAYLLENSTDGLTWSTVVSTTVDNPDLYKSMRVNFNGGVISAPDDGGVIGSINLSPPNNTGAFFQFF